MLSHLAAYDFGYISAESLLRKLRGTFTTLAGLERHKGHFYNWYDTETLAPLQPLYISTVDSGNLAGHLLTLRQSLLELENRPIFHSGMLRGLNDTALILGESLRQTGPASNAVAAFTDALLLLREQDMPPARMVEALRRLAELAETIRKDVSRAGEEALLFWSRQLTAQCGDILADLESLVVPGAPSSGDPWPAFAALATMDIYRLPESARDDATKARRRAAGHVALARDLARTAEIMADMDFSFLYDRDRRLLSIGYNVNDQRLDASYYDLLASESRLTYYVGIAQGQLPQESWFALGRLLTADSGTPTLLSWSGSMFEYLMPLLVMPGYEGTLLDETCKGAVEAQQRYAASQGIPWGISESGYNMRDGQRNYQYRAFGVPGLGLQRGLGENLVVAPYATALALMVNPSAAAENLQNLADKGLAGRYGMHEAVDYTAVHLPRGKDSEIIYSYMAHHQGMSLLSLANLLHGNAMPRRFLADPAMLATRLLLEERMPETAPESLNACKDTGLSESGARSEEKTLRVFKSPDNPSPPVQLLSNGRYHVVISGAGGGTAASTTWRSRAGGRTRPGTTGARSSTCAMSRAAVTGPRYTSPFAAKRIFTRPCSATRGRNSACGKTTSSHIPKSRCPRKTISSCGASGSETEAGKNG